MSFTSISSRPVGFLRPLAKPDDSETALHTGSVPTPASERRPCGAMDHCGKRRAIGVRCHRCVQVIRRIRPPIVPDLR